MREGAPFSASAGKIKPGETGKDNEEQSQDNITREFENFFQRSISEFEVQRSRLRGVFLLLKLRLTILGEKLEKRGRKNRCISRGSNLFCK